MPAMIQPQRLPAQRSQIAKRVLRIALDNRCADRVGYANPAASVEE